MKPWVAYSLVRVGIFAVVFVALMIAGIEWWWCALIAAVISVCIGYIFFRPLRDAVANDLQGRRSAPAPDADADAEDAR